MVCVYSAQHKVSVLIFKNWLHCAAYVYLTQNLTNITIAIWRTISEHLSNVQVNTCQHLGVGKLKLDLDISTVDITKRIIIWQKLNFEWKYVDMLENFI